MSESFRKNHLRVHQFSEVNVYRYPVENTRIEFNLKERNRNAHGAMILNKLNEVKQTFDLNQGVDLPPGITNDDVIYVEFYSEWGFELKFEQFHDNRPREKYQLLSIQKEINSNDPDNKKNFRYRVLVMLKEGGISHFINRVQKYLTENSKYRGEETNNPIANKLVANISDVKLATLEGFWTDGIRHPFPNAEEIVWWEVWFRRSGFEEDKIHSQLSNINAIIGHAKLEFEENVVQLVKASAKQLSESLMFLDSLAELRKPQELSDFLVSDQVDYSSKMEWLDDIKNRIDNQISDDSVLICLLDSGVNTNHELLKNLVPDSHLYSWKADWGIYDTEPNGGHGTGMAGLALFGDLIDAAGGNDPIRIYHGIESFKVKHPSSHTEKELYGVVYQDGCNAPVVDRPNNLRVYCLTVTNQEFTFYGRPSSSSASIDKIAFGRLGEGGGSELIVVSGGNVCLNKHNDYPSTNFIESIHDPAQAYNALTVGAYTTKNRLSNQGQAIAAYGSMSPNNSTSAAWEQQWPNKPDVVFEGGNLETDGINLNKNPDLEPVSLDSEFPNFIFIPFDGTSSASAFASKMAAELRTKYPGFWPETIRGLIAHSADWTEAMILDTPNYQNEAGKRSLLRSVGYGVPNIETALYSANNSLTLISESWITPYVNNNGSIQYKEYNLYELPWPKDVLENEIGDSDVRLKVTLSYFIEPNPGNRQYERSFSYHSHDLDFKLIKPGESLVEFKRRVSAATEGLSIDSKPDLSGEEWTVGRVRSRGSLKKDFLNTNGVELANRYHLAVFPKAGWYKSRKKLGKFNNRVRYSLIISIETEDIEVDIYTPVENLIPIEIPI